MWATLGRPLCGPGRGLPVCLPDRAAEAFAGGGEVVFGFADLPLGVAGFGGAGVALGGELAGGGFEAGGAGDQPGPAGSFDLGAGLGAQPGAELVVVGAEPVDLVAGDGQVGAQAGLGDWLAAGRRRGGRGGRVPGLAAAGWTCSRMPSA